MPPPTSSRSTVPSRLAMTPSLSETLAPPSTTTYGRSGFSVSCSRTSVSAATRPTGGVRQPLRDVVDAGVLAVDGAEAVTDVGVGERGQAVGEGATLGVVLARLRRLEPQVLEQRDVAVLQATDHRLCVVADRVRGERDRPAEQLRQARGDRSQREPGLRRALGATEVGAHDDPGPRLDERVDRREAGPDPAVVGDGHASRPRPSASGTLRSDRTRTRRPETPSARRSSRVRISLRGSRRRSRRGRRGGCCSPTRCRTSRRP